MNTTVEEAKKCPKCGQYGQQMSSTPVSTGPNSDIRPGTKALIMTCVNQACRWFSTQWPIQVNPDGTVPVASASYHKANKQYPTISKERIAGLIEATEALAAEEIKKQADGSSPELRRRGF